MRFLAQTCNIVTKLEMHFKCTVPFAFASQGKQHFQQRSWMGCMLPTKTPTQGAASPLAPPTEVSEASLAAAASGVVKNARTAPYLRAFVSVAGGSTVDLEQDQLLPDGHDEQAPSCLLGTSSPRASSAHCPPNCLDKPSGSPICVVLNGSME